MYKCLSKRNEFFFSPTKGNNFCEWKPVTRKRLISHFLHLNWTIFTKEIWNNMLKSFRLGKFVMWSSCFSIHNCKRSSLIQLALAYFSSHTTLICQTNIHEFNLIIKKNTEIKYKEHLKQVAFQSNANHPLAEGTGYIKFEGM